MKEEFAIRSTNRDGHQHLGGIGGVAIVKHDHAWFELAQGDLRRFADTFAAEGGANRSAVSPVKL